MGWMILLLLSHTADDGGGSGELLTIGSGVGTLLIQCS